MTGYDVYLSDGSLLTTINVKTIDDQQSTSLFLIGQGIPDYGTDIAQNLVWMVENFANTTPPVNPLVGQQWYDSSDGNMKVWNGTNWYSFVTSETTSENLLAAVLDVDFTVEATIPLFTVSGSSLTYCPVRLLLVPVGAFDATISAIIDLTVVSAGDVLDAYTVPIIADTQFINKSLGPEAAAIPGSGGTLSLQITSAASGGQLSYNVYVFAAYL